MKLIDMRKTNEEMANEGMPFLGPRDEYPCGLTLTFDKPILEKLGVDHHDWEVGDIFDLRAMARVKGIYENETENGKDCRIELQIVMMGAESEDDEGEEEDED